MIRHGLLLLLFSFFSAFGQTGGTITTIAGTGVAGYNGDDIPAAQARLNFGAADSSFDEEDIIHIAFDASGNLYIPDRDNGRIRKVTPNGMITTMAGAGDYNFGGDKGPATRASFRWPTAVVADTAGNLYVADYWNCAIRRVDMSGMITTIAGTPTASDPCGFAGNGGKAVEAQLDFPVGLAFDKPGNLYISDEYNSWVRKLSLDGILTVYAGDQTKHPPDGWAYGGDNGPATAALMNYPAGLAVDSAGRLYIADEYNHCIRRISPDGIITSVAGVCGSQNSGYNGDNRPAKEAFLNYPVDVALDSAGNLYIADQDNKRIRKVSPEGIITTVAGNGTAGYNGDNIAATDASLNFPSGLTLDTAGNLYVVDHFNNRIRKISASLGPAPGFPSNGVTSAASFLGGHVAPGELISIFGTNLGPDPGVGLEIDPGTGRIATSRAGVSVLFNNVPAPLFYVSKNQINLQVPYELAGQESVQIVARNQNASSAAVTVPVGPTAPGIFTASQGKGPAAMLNQDFTANSAANPAMRGSVVQIFMTGQGATQPTAVTGQLPQAPLPTPVQPVTVTIGGRPARTQFAGLAPGLAGLLQVNAVVPDDLTPGDAVSLTVAIGSVSSQPGVTLSVR